MEVVWPVWWFHVVFGHHGFSNLSSSFVTNSWSLSHLGRFREIMENVWKFWIVLIENILFLLNINIIILFIHIQDIVKYMEQCQTNKTYYVINYLNKVRNFSKKLFFQVSIIAMNSEIIFYLNFFSDFHGELNE